MHRNILQNLKDWTLKRLVTMICEAVTVYLLFIIIVQYDIDRQHQQYFLIPAKGFLKNFFHLELK